MIPKHNNQLGRRFEGNATVSGVHSSVALISCSNELSEGRLATCSFLKGRKFPGTVKLTRAGQDSQAQDTERPIGHKDGEASLSASGEAAVSEVDDRQARSLHGEPSTSQQVIQYPSRKSCTGQAHGSSVKGSVLLGELRGYQIQGMK